MTTPESGIPLVSYMEGKMGLVAPKTVSEFNELLAQPIKDFGRALHTEFSGLNLRGIRTHDVSVYRGHPNDYSSIEGGVRLEPDKIIIVSELTASEVVEAGPSLQLFLNQLQIKPEDIVKGIVVLGKTNEPIPESECPYEIALVVSKDALQEGKSGILFKSYGYVDLFPSLSDQEFRSEAEKNNHRLFDDLSSASVGRVFHPLVARGATETAALVGKAIVSRRIATDLFS